MLPETTAHHVLRTLRLRTGDALALFDGTGGEWHGTLGTVSRERVEVRLTHFKAVARESPLQCLLAQGLSSGERMDYTLQKAVELGVHAIQPLATRRSVVRLDEARAARRLAHWREVVISACEQCGRDRIPEVMPLVALDAWLTRTHGTRVLLLDPAAAMRLADLPRPAGAQWLLAGPEGGFDPDERAAVLAAGGTGIHLGPRVLRTETAALAALAAMQALWGDF